LEASGAGDWGEIIGGGSFDDVSAEHAFVEEGCLEKAEVIGGRICRESAADLSVAFEDAAGAIAEGGGLEFRGHWDYGHT
jgi:hypothetical protein